jgi:hypothetical protein
MPEELLPKVLQRLLSSVRLRTEAGVQGPGHGAAECSGWKCHHDALAMRLPLRQDATDEGRLGCSGRWCGAAVASLEFKLLV